jgi:hypothetical protein
VKAGEQVAVTLGWGDNESVVDIATVKSVSKTGRVTVNRVVYPHGNEVYDPNGWARGDATGSIRNLKETECVDEIVARIRAIEQAKRDRRNAEYEARQAKAKAELDKASEWVKANAKVTRMETINCSLDIVELPIPGQPATLVIRISKDEHFWGDETWTASIMVNHTRYEGRMDGGITSANSLPSPDPLVAAAQWVRSWVDLDAI